MPTLSFKEVLRRRLCLYSCVRTEWYYVDDAMSVYIFLNGLSKYPYIMPKIDQENVVVWVGARVGKRRGWVGVRVGKRRTGVDGGPPARWGVL